jgi:uncharacterized protein (DUF1697 family)
LSSTSARDDEGKRAATALITVPEEPCLVLELEPPASLFELKFVAFFRNVNLGRPNCPTRHQLEDAFAHAGAKWVSSFLTNGTLVFDAAGKLGARSILASALRTLHSGCRLTEPAYIRTIKQLTALVDLEPFASIDPASVYERCVSFLPPSGFGLTTDLPLESKRGDVELIRITDTEVLSVSRKIGNTPGSPNAFLEKSLSCAVTTRAWNTVVRLVQRHA